MGNYRAEPNGKDPNLLKVKRNKARSITDWLRGIKAGRLERQINIYYDNIKELSEEQFEEVHVDPARMSRLEQLTKIQQLENLILEHEQGNSTKATGPEEPATTG